MSVVSDCLCVLSLCRASRTAIAPTQTGWLSAVLPAVCLCVTCQHPEHGQGDVWQRPCAHPLQRLQQRRHDIRLRAVVRLEQGLPGALSAVYLCNASSMLGLCAPSSPHPLCRDRDGPAGFLCRCVWADGVWRGLFVACCRRTTRRRCPTTSTCTGHRTKR